MANLRRGEYGTQNLYFYPIEGGSYSSPIQQLGLRAVTREVEQEITSFFADNRVHLQIPGTKVITGEITTYQLEDESYQEVLGFYKNLSGAFTDSGSSKKFGFAYGKKTLDANGVESFIIVVLYDCIATEPPKEDTTTEDTVELTELVSPYTSKVSDFVVDDNGVFVSYMFFTMPQGTTEADVQALLGAGIPLPTDNLPKGSEGSITLGAVTDTQIDGTYDYTDNQGNLATSALNIYAATDLNTPLPQSIAPATVGTGQVFSFTGLTPQTAYVIKLQEGTQIQLDSVNVSTLITDITPPVITGDATANFTVGQLIGFEGSEGDSQGITTFNLSAIDDVDGDVTSNIVLASNADGLVGDGTDIAGTYNLTYTVDDNAGNTSLVHTVVVTIA